MRTGDLPISSLSADDVQAALSRGDDFVLLDVREEWEWSRAHIAGALHIPMNDIPQRVTELDRARTIVVMCHLGQRSAMVAQYLQGQGFAAALNMDGGIDEWLRRGYPVE